MKTNFHPRSVLSVLLAASVTLFTQASAIAQQADIKTLSEIVANVGHEGAGHVPASKAVAALGKSDKSRLPEMLTGMDGMSLLAANWMRGAIEAVADKPGDLPVARLQAFLAEDGHSQQGRRIAYELLTRNDPTLAEKMLPNMLEDTSLENRQDAVQWLVDQLDAKADKDAAIAGLRKALDSARSIEQVKSIVKQLGELDVKVDLTQRLGFITDWKLIGPFDNTDEKGFDVVYPPEAKVDLDEKLPGKLGEIAWISVTTDKELGMVDLTGKLDKHKGAIAYAFKEFVADRDQPAEIRLGCINASKVWLNGEPVMSNEIYHSGTRNDQYVAAVNLKKGSNSILVKVCQNEQEQPWAQVWEFKLRVCDASGKPIHSQERGDDSI